MEIVVLVVVVLFVAGLVVWWTMSRGASGPVAVRREDRLDTLAGWPPQATRILTTAERLAWSTLSRGLPGYMVLAQVPIARFTRVPTRNSYAEWLRRVGSDCADLVVCDMASHVVAVVHVQAQTGEQNERAKRRHARMARVLKAEGIPMYTWREGALPTPEMARAQILRTPTDSAPMPFPETAAEAPAAGAPAAPRGPSPFDDSRRDSTLDERIELRDAPPSTWFDDLETAPAPLDGPREPRKP